MKKKIMLFVAVLLLSGCSLFTKYVCPANEIKLNIEPPKAMEVNKLEPKLRLVERQGVRYVEMTVEEYEKIPELLILLQNRVDILEVYLEQYRKFNE